MSCFDILAKIGAIKPGKALDIGARNGELSCLLSRHGYDVDAIDPVVFAELSAEKEINFVQTRLEDFVTTERYDLIVASLVSHHLTYSLEDFFIRLESLLADGGLVYLTLLGDDDDWAAKPIAKCVSFDEAITIFESVGFHALYKGTEWFEGRVYSGEGKFWNLFHFVLKRPR
ncbi:methyltransferase domain-containing protein [uncultured Cohaesibacter sp.]|uniref:class I SAM-dependent methyltransferase n=1 Tax=uncultured Cohaesibacter sp. TaxID=1002546 RepID=UPI002AA72279|nr:methyltransferase domain-containing protein [uncultured Cohaesibacter sp.]